MIGRVSPDEPPPTDEGEKEERDEEEPSVNAPHHRSRPFTAPLLSSSGDSVQPFNALVSSSGDSVQPFNDLGSIGRTRRVLITNLPPRTTEREVLRKFSAFGNVRDIKNTPLTRSCALVYARSRDAAAAVLSAHNMQLFGGGFILVVQPSPRRHSSSQDDAGSVSTGTRGTQATDDSVEAEADPDPDASGFSAGLSLKHLFNGQEGDVEEGRAAAGGNSSWTPRVLLSAPREDEDRPAPRPLKRRCRRCPKLFRYALFMVLRPSGLSCVVQSGLVYLLLYPICILECVYWLVKNLLQAILEFVGLCLEEPDASEEGMESESRRGVCRLLPFYLGEMAIYAALLVTCAVPVLPLLAAVSTTHGREAAMLPSVLGPLSPLRLTLLTTLGDDSNYLFVSREKELWPFLRASVRR